MTDYMSRKTTKEVYERAQANRGYVTDEDMKVCFSESERWGYGVYGAQAFKDEEGYHITFCLGSSCD